MSAFLEKLSKQSDLQGLISPLVPSDKSLFQDFWKREQAPYRFENSWPFVMQFVEVSSYKYFDGVALMALATDHVDGESITMVRPMGKTVHIRAAELARRIRQQSGAPSVNVRYLSESEYQLFLEQGFIARGNKYPQVVLNVEDLLKLDGKEWSKIRLRINRFRKHFQYICADVNEASSELASQVCRAWQSSYFGRYGISPRRPPIISNFLWLIELIGSSALTAETYSFVVIANGSPAGLCVSSPVSDRCVGVYINICDTGFPGLAEFLVYELARRVHADGYDAINLGHSDLLSTHEFKCKFSPFMFLPTASVEFR